MLCSSCGAECADDLEVCAACGAPLKKSPVSVDTIPLPVITEAESSPAGKKPVKLDIQAILAAYPLPDDPDPAQPAPEAVETPDSSEPEKASGESSAVDSDGSKAADNEEPDDPINPVEVLLLSLCILLGIAIAAMIVLIIWPNLITMLFYRG